MLRERMLRFVLIVAGLLCLAGLYPLEESLRNWQHADEIVRCSSACMSRSAFSCWSRRGILRSTAA